MPAPERDLLRRLFDAAVAAADPLVVLAPHLPPPPAEGVLELAGLELEGDAWLRAMRVLHVAARTLATHALSIFRVSRRSSIVFEP